jgi:PAT family beta-lactamase induction signal transducer AmpG
MAQHINNNYFTILLQRKFLVILIFGFCSGLPLAMITSVLQTWFSYSGVSLKLIGAASLISWPYAVKFLWAPFLDRYKLPYTDRRLGWMVCLMLCLLLSLSTVGLYEPSTSANTIMWLCLLVAILSASLDIVIDAYKIEITNENERGMAGSLGIEGYRAAMLLSGSVTLIVAQYYGFKYAYFGSASLFIIGIITAIFIAPRTSDNLYRRDLASSFVLPLTDLLKRKNIILLMLFILCYKIADALALALNSHFFRSVLNLSLTEIAFYNKTIGLVSSLSGVFLGGMILIRFKLYNCLLFFGALQAITNLLWLLLLYYPGVHMLISGVVVIEHLCGGIGTAAFVAFLMKLCNKEFSGSQYAILSAITAMPRTWIGPFAAYLVENYGWDVYYITSFIIGIPAVILLIYIKKSFD